MSNLHDKVIKLAYEKPEYREYLLPLLKSAADVVVRTDAETRAILNDLGKFGRNTDLVWQFRNSPYQLFDPKRLAKGLDKWLTSMSREERKLLRKSISVKGKQALNEALKLKAQVVEEIENNFRRYGDPGRYGEEIYDALASRDTDIDPDFKLYFSDLKRIQQINLLIAEGEKQIRGYDAVIRKIK